MMTDGYNAPPELVAILILREGDNPRAYQDTKGIWTAGIGRNLQSHGLSPDEAIDLLRQVDLPESTRRLMLANDLAVIGHQVAGVVGDLKWQTLDDVRKAALVDMGMMGAAKLAQFHKMLFAVCSGDWAIAAKEALASQWASDVGPARANEVAEMLRTGEWPARVKGASA